ncbi:T9SS type A sorting domain-containing protein [Epilithonimonas zeae]|uniref:Por secretion system C-terminal sorting domain-containing protein n=1 Tax=Epilithonimonas zeae TaxID=1416779 RepID=A0A1N6I9Q2_9FLAO|nr:T9SS type A sorting domain-containing protein [Epilithonimonas zeae]SIO28751.1 Por secretion system C-terminal sorting domain-containing protein [Epilithonimonas zeae]
MKTIFTLLAVIISFTISAQTVNIPDANFKAYLLNNPQINTNSDNEIQVSEASTATHISCHSKNISNLSGIEYFVNLKVLECYNNNLSTLNISNLSNLIEFDCNKNKLTSIDTTQNKKLKNFSCSNNFLTNIDVSENTYLEYFSCNGNQISELNVNQNILLYYLHCNSNLLTQLDLSLNSHLYFIHIGNNKVSNIDFSQNQNLGEIYAQGNLLTNVDLSQNKKLMIFKIDNNLLSNLNIKNGFNTLITAPDEEWNFFSSVNNPDLKCIQVDNVNYSTSNWPNKDSWANYSTNCSLGVDDVKKLTIQIYPNPVKDTFIINTNDKIETIEIYSQTGQLLKTSKSKEVDISNLPKGNYLVKIKTDKDNITQKIIKE